MKKPTLYLSAFFVLYSILSFGQTTISRNNFFSMGNSYPFMFLDSLRQDTISITGNNVIWDFSNAVAAAVQDTLHIIDPVNSTFYNYPNTNYNISNFCFYEPLGYSAYLDSMYSYYIDDTSSIFYIGGWANSGVWETGLFHYTDTDKVYTFPFSLNDIYSDTLTGSYFDFSGGGYHAMHGRRIVEADGFGTLIMPNMTYPNCLRIKSTRHMTDSAMFTFYSWTDTSYTWFQLNRSGYILKIDNEFAFRTNKYYYSNPLINSLPEAIQENRITLFPNPCHSNLTFKWENAFAGNAIITIRNVIGQLIRHDEITRLSPLENRNIDVSNLMPGYYTIEIKTQEQIGFGKFIKE